MTLQDLPGALDAIPTDGREHDLWVAFERSRAPDAREALFDFYLSYAAALAGKLYRGRHRDDVEYQDYMQFSCVGLLESIDRFDRTRGVAFTTFATQRIKGSVLDGVVRLTDGQEQTALRASIRRERLESLKDASSDEPRDVFRVLASVTVGLAISFMLDDTGMIGADPSAAQPFQDHPYRTLAQQQTRSRLYDAVDLLPAREQKIIRYHYFHRLSFEHIADILNLSKGRISQLHRAALDELRRQIGTDDFYLLA
ncbi:sigma-70 family RNA polymerase sigma factor [Burkholderia sp. BCC1972]|uniref:sigma-70 family RNA polymerase sigma factor n=1 Tax=Burkholderia sp. BCC1972 TaxID=2817438 RepID=UPI002ABE4187|nr:sigma-70 family RNA polymerase sigma factor [Burkholderia sp. BCC1972]